MSAPVRTAPQQDTAADRRIPWLIMLGFAVVIAVNVAFIVVAVQGRDPVVAGYAVEAR
jgi:nitrogen fixation protein FixH